MDSALLQDLHDDARRIAQIALTEDGETDITTELTVAPNVRATAIVEARNAGVLAGTAYADAVTRECGLGEVEWHVKEGESFPEGVNLGTIKGSLRAILRSERPLLNLLQRACGIASATHAYVDELRGTGCRVLHTRKTAPGLRSFDVRAVLAGGGLTHRVDLSTVVMIKDNHWRGLETSGVSLSEIRASASHRAVDAFQVEVESEPQVEIACAAGATRVLIDNQTPETFAAWALLARQRAPGIEVEATGGITLKNVREYADAGADFISIGALTHSVRALDLALEVSLD